jgi:hypothetical protein
MSDEFRQIIDPKLFGVFVDGPRIPVTAEFLKDLQSGLPLRVSLIEEEEENMDNNNDQRANVIRTWLEGHDHETTEAIIPKAVAYGSADLEIMGEAMLTLMPQLRGKVAGAELGIAFYALGKVARLFGAYAQGAEPHIDSWYDMEVYAKMAQKVRETGEW